MQPSQLRMFTNTSYALYLIIIIVIIILLAQHPSTVAYNIMGSPSLMILMLIIAGLGVAVLFGSTMLKGTFMSSNYTNIIPFVMMIIMVVLIIYASVSFGKYGKNITIMAIIISLISFVLFYFQKNSMF